MMAGFLCRSKVGGLGHLRHHTTVNIERFFCATVKPFQVFPVIVSLSATDNNDSIASGLANAPMANQDRSPFW